MPEVSRFFGIIITMYHVDHPPPHFHARYGSTMATFSVADLRLLDGRLPPRVVGLVAEWASQHQPELLANWERARARQPLSPIAPLE